LLTFYISLFRFIILSTSYIIPQYLGAIQNYRAMETGRVLLWIALPQFFVAPVVATILRFVDARVPMAFGFAMVGWACFMAGQLTHDWATGDFLLSQLLQAVGQTFALTSVVWFALKHLELKEVLTFGAVIQTARLFGGELGSGFIQTFLRVREQMYSNLVGLHVIVGSHTTEERLQYYANLVGDRSNGQSEARATAFLAHAVQNQANVLSYIDGFMLLGFSALAALFLMLMLKDPPAQPLVLGSAAVARPITS
jgi:DHA2 family multidrug resistance protein